MNRPLIRGHLNNMKRSPMKRTGRLRSRSRKNGSLSKHDPKDLDRDAQQALVAALTEEAGHRCENPMCRLPKPLDPHHVLKRSQGGRWSRENIILLCRKCHDWTDEAGAARNGRLIVIYQGTAGEKEMFEFHEYHEPAFDQVGGPSIPWRQIYVRGGSNAREVRPTAGAVH